MASVPGSGVGIDATRPLSEVVDEVLRRAGAVEVDPRDGVVLTCLDAEVGSAEY
ncbi:hypothetical protein IEZ26_22460 [Nocardioides cavernae]|uniref:Uncharacterized protein n=1 Tax=Nocardioides cavernae TaxID=1921566 RepID=A0ABR8NH03_9ACTN|nr:hypothetical protein [Nocardioides cavernae]MBD3927403.1 hypothetical protein [Nocardioides cavernae]MBM7512994.1 hypothetical protein [Nocardioides cavernae]